MIGYTKTTKIWKLWDLEAKWMLRSTDVIFIEEENAIKTLPGREPEATFLGREHEATFLGREPEATVLGREPEATFLGREPEVAFMGREPELPKVTFMGREREVSPATKAKKHENPEDMLPKQADEDLARLTASEADYALNAQVTEILEDAEPLTFQELHY